MGLIGNLANAFYHINEGIIYSTFLVDIIVTLINLNEYVANPGFANFLSTLLSFNLVLFLQHVLGSVFGQMGIIAGGVVTGLATVGALFTRNFLLNMGQQNMNVAQVIFIYLLIQFIFNSFESILVYSNVVLMPLLSHATTVQYLSAPIATLATDFSALLTFVASFGEVMSVIYVLMATGMWSEM